MRVRLACCVLLAWIALPAFGQQPASPSPTAVLDLNEVLAEVQANNPSLRAAGLNAEALAQRRAQVSALPDPTLGLTYQPFPMLTAHGAQRLQLRVEQMIPYPGKLGLQGAIADLGAEIATRETEVLAEDLLLQAKQAYYDLYRIQQTDALIASFQDDLQGFEDVATVRYEVGQGAQQAVLKAQLEKNQLTQRLLDLRERRRRAAEMLARLTGQPGGTRYFQTVRLTPPDVPDIEAASLLNLAFQQRPEMEMLEVAAERADRQIELAEKQFRPDFGVNLTYFDIAARDMPATATGRDALAIGASIKVPLQRGRLRAGVEEARLRRAEIDARQEALRTHFETQIDDLIYALAQEAEALTLYDQTLLPQATTTVEATLSAYTTGRTDFLNLLDAERTLFALRTSYEDTLNRYLKTAAALERALGIPSLSDLDTLVLQAIPTDIPLSAQDQ